jgi:Uma2 family endonuclease
MEPCVAVRRDKLATGDPTMADPTPRRMTLSEFLVWDDGTDIRYELINGVAVAMAPPAELHGVLAARLAAFLQAALRDRPPCTVRMEAGITRPGRNDSFYVADLAVTCVPPKRGRQTTEDPILIVEILSPSTELHDRKRKVPEYRWIGSVQQIVLVDSETAQVEVLTREGERWLAEVVRGRGATLSLGSVALEVSMAELYRDLDVDELDD